MMIGACPYRRSEKCPYRNGECDGSISGGRSFLGSPDVKLTAERDGDYYLSACIEVSCRKTQPGDELLRDDNGCNLRAYELLLDGMPDCEKSGSRPDVMTNPKYVLHLAWKALADGKMAKQKLTGPHYWDQVCGRSGNIGLMKQLENCPRLREALSRFAEAAYTIGNCWLIPNDLLGLGAAVVNSKKADVVSTFRKGEYVNDQFALFAEWVEGKKSDGTTEEEKVAELDCWLEKMAIDEVWGLYLAAARSLHMVYGADKRDERIGWLVLYLDIVTSAIRFRGMLIEAKGRKRLDAGDSSPRAS